MDEWDLARYLEPGTDGVVIEVAGYNVNRYYLLDQSAFLQAEVVADDRVLAATGAEGASFEAQLLTDRVQRVQRYSFQRPLHRDREQTESTRAAAGAVRERA